MKRRDLLLSSGSVIAMTAISPAALAQADKPVRIVVGFAPGGSADILARLIAQYMGKKGVSAIVENKTGAAGRLAPLDVKNSPADGRTILITPDVIVSLYPYTFKRLAYDPLVDLRPLSQIVKVPIGLAVGPMVPASVKTMADFAAWCKANPSKASYGSAGAGTSLHFIGVMYAQANQMELTHVPYRGGAPAAQDVVAGQIAASVNVVSELIPFAQAGKLRVLAVSSEKRASLLPDVPTFAEAGYKSLEQDVWFGALVHGKTTDAATQQLSALVAEASRTPEMREAVERLGFEVVGSTPALLGAVIKSDQARWSEAVKKAGYTAEDS